MCFNWISEKTKLQLPANLIDFDDIQIGLEFGLSPEILNLLAGQAATGPLAEHYLSSDNRQSPLDEHELALG